MTLPSQSKTDTMQLIELAEGVEVEARPAGPVSRARAWMIDGLIMALIFVALLVARGFSGFVFGEETSAGVFLLAMFFLNWGYRVVFEAGKRGATPGKRWMKLRVVNSYGAPIGWTAAILRNLLRAVDMLPFAYLTGLISCMATKRFQRLGDLVAGTMVVYDREAFERGTAEAPPPAGPELLGEPAPPPVTLTREERGALVRFAERAGRWSPGRREELANHLRALTGAEGAEGVRRVAGMGVWLRDS